MKKHLRLLGAALSLGLAGCLSSGAVDEPVLSQNRGPRESAPVAGREAPPVVLAEARRPAAAARDDSAVLRELAAVKADLRVAQEDLQKLIMRIEILERDGQAKDRQLAELQSLVAAMDGQFAAADKQWSERMENLRKNMESERADRRREMESMSSAVAHEISNLRDNPPRPATPEIRTVEIEVMRGDTLSTIAQKAKTTVRQIKELNGLKSDNIRVGQRLKIPVN